MAVKKISKKVSKKKVSKKKVAKVSSSANMASPAVGTLDGQLGEVIVTGSRRRLANHRKANRGEFRGDFTRDTFDLHNRFSRVLMQQGRVQLDADWNEQSSIALYQLRNLACDVGSEHWGPRSYSGFKIPNRDENNNNFSIRPGHYYVNGIFCEIGLDENNDFLTYETQPDFPLPDDQTVAALTNIFETANVEMRALVYLDVWERHYNYINDDSIREVALGGPDTATRAKVIWQVKILPVPFEENSTGDDGLNRLKTSYRDFLDLIDSEVKPGKGRLCAKVKDKANDNNDPCLVAPESRYRGTENQLYRVEIHKTGVAEGHAEDSDLSTATYKWSRENSSVNFPIVSLQDPIITLEHLGKDCRYGLKPNDWVELIDDDHSLQCRADNLFQVESIDKESRQVTLSNTSGSIIEIDVKKHAYLRRWDHVGGDETGIAVVEKPDGEMWLELEDGIQVQFKGSNEATLTDANGNSIENSATFKTGDYWLIPARTVTGDIEWPTSEGEPEALIPHGVVHHYAPLAILNKGGDSDGDGDIDEGENVDLRRIIIRTWS
jgi:hypothetical protein